MTDYPPPSIKTGPGRRLVARIIDGVVLFIPVLIVTAPIAGGFRIGGENVGGRRILATAIGLTITYGYFVVLEATRGATIGKSAMGMEVRGPDGLPSYAQAATRNAFVLLSVVPGTIGGVLSLAVALAIGITIATDDAGQGIHDRWAGLFVERRRATP